MEISANRGGREGGGGGILSNYVGMISEHEVGELIHQITHCFNVKHH